MNLSSILNRFKDKPTYQSLFLGLDKFDEETDISQFTSHKPVIMTGVGRSGTHFLAKLFEQKTDFASFHLDDIGESIGDSYNWFRKWYYPNASTTNLIKSREYLIYKSLNKNKRFLESNPMLALFIDEFSNAMQAQIVITIRHPKQVVESHYHKGWYHQFDNDFIEPFPDFSYIHNRSNHFFSRITPKDNSEFNEWKKLTTVGKITWMWVEVNKTILKQTDNRQSVKYIYINSFKYNEYLDLCGWLNSSKTLSKSAFEEIYNRKPGKSSLTKKPAWNKQEITEYNQFINSIKPFFDFIPESNTWII